jgi:16S rRNA (guanine(1405)-N(7))-methyltransferase
MTAEIVERVRRSSRYRDVDPLLVERLAADELPRSTNVDDAVKRVKRRLHQAVGAFRGGRSARHAGLESRDALLATMRAHASTRERLPYLDRFYADIWALTGTPRRLMDLGCGLNPLALPWMQLDPTAVYLASDVDERPLATVRRVLAGLSQPHVVEVRDLVAAPPEAEADLALLLKLVTTLDRQDPDAAERLLRALRVRHAVVSFATRSLGGRGDRRDRAYRARMERLVAGVGRVRGVAEASAPNELVFVLELVPADG